MRVQLDGSRSAVVILFLFLSASFCSEVPQKSENVAESESAAIESVQERTEAVSKETFAYDCEDGTNLVAQLEIQTDTFTLFLPGRTVQLQHLPSGSGAKYGNENLTFWTKGSESLLIEEEGTLRCVENRRQSILEDAKLRGIDFRGTGNEPGWSLEIGPDSIVFITNYGGDRYELPTPTPEVNRGERRTTYEARGDGHELIVILEGRECQDTMADESFETTVTVTLDGKSVKGCGTPLH